MNFKYFFLETLNHESTFHSFSFSIFRIWISSWAASGSEYWGTLFGVVRSITEYQNKPAALQSQRGWKYECLRIDEEGGRKRFIKFVWGGRWRRQRRARGSYEFDTEVLGKLEYEEVISRIDGLKVGCLFNTICLLIFLPIIRLQVLPHWDSYRYFCLNNICTYFRSKTLLNTDRVNSSNYGAMSSIHRDQHAADVFAYVLLIAQSNFEACT